MRIYPYTHHQAENIITINMNVINVCNVFAVLLKSKYDLTASSLRSMDYEIQ